MRPILQRRHNRHILGFELIKSGFIKICDAAFADQYRSLRFPDRQHRTVFYFITVAFEAIYHGIAAIIRPLDNINKFAQKLIKNSHFIAPDICYFMSRKLNIMK